MTLSSFAKGDILRAKLRGRTEGFHSIVFISHNSSSDFIGAMITHSSSYEGYQNIAMKESHFEKADKISQAYKLVFDKTYLVPRKFIKPRKWGPFTVAGKLSSEGIAFVESLVQNFPEETFDDYFKSIMIPK